MARIEGGETKLVFRVDYDFGGGPRREGRGQLFSDRQPPSLETQKHPVHCAHMESWGRQAGQALWARGLCVPQGAEGRGVRTPLTT